MGTTVVARGSLLLVPVILCFLTPVTVWAETPKLALSQIVEFSLQHNGDLKAFREEKGIRDAGKTKAGLLPNPIIELEGGTGALTGSSAENNLSLWVYQEFLLAGKREKRLAVAEHELETYRWQLADRERLLRDEVKSAYYDLILAVKRLALADSFIALNRQLLDVTRQRLAAGDIPELEMNLVKVELARSNGKKLEIEKILKQNRTKLFNFMGLPFGERPEITGDFAAVIPFSKTLAELTLSALGKRPDLKALETERTRGESDIILAQAEGIPNITGGLAFRRDATSMEVGGVEGKDTAYTIALKLTMPIPLFDKNQAGIQEARARRNSTENRLLAVTQKIGREVETAYAGFENADSVLVMYRTDILPQLEENLKLTQEAYRLGEVGILTVIEEQKKFFEINDGYLTALHDRQMTLVTLETAVATELTGGAQ